MGNSHAEEINPQGPAPELRGPFLPLSIAAVILAAGLVPFAYTVWLFIAQGGDPATVEVRHMQRAVRPWWLTLLAIAACTVPFTRLRNHRQTALTVVFLIVYFIAAGYFYF